MNYKLKFLTMVLCVSFVGCIAPVPVTVSHYTIQKSSQQ